MNKHPDPSDLPANDYWPHVRRLSAQLLIVWFFATCVIAVFARELATITLFGWPVSFYLAAQGVVLLYFMIVVIYAWRMRRLERRYPADEADA